MKHTRVVSTKCTPGFACRAFSDTTLVCFIVNEHTTKCSRYTHTGVSRVASFTTFPTKTTQAKCDPQSRGFWLRANVYFHSLPIKCRVGCSKCVIAFCFRSKYIIIGNVFTNPVSTDAILFPLRPNLSNKSYTVSFSRHSPDTSVIVLKLRSRKRRCDANSFTEGIAVRKLLLATKCSKSRKPRK